MTPQKKPGEKNAKSESPVQPRVKEKEPPPVEGTSQDPLYVVGIAIAITERSEGVRNE